MGNVYILEKIKKYHTISIIGMDKNVGKTTVLNYILDESRGKLKLGLTSIGRDGEEKDRALGTEKPKIYIESGTYIATTKGCLYNGDITKEIIATTNINTPMGEVVIAKALSDGYVELGGASINSYMKQVCKKLLQLGSELVIVDGAISRKTTASPAVTEGCVLCTGASLNRSMDKVVEMTAHTVELLSLEKEDNEKILELANKELSSSKIGIINRDMSTNSLEVLTALQGAKLIAENLNENVTHVLIRGLVTDNFIENLIKATDKYKIVTFLVEDGTKLFISSHTLNKFKRLGGKLKSMERINLICITCNPKSPYGYEFNKDMFLEKLREGINLPVYDVVAEGGD
jgi:hypothetical protein